MSQIEVDICIIGAGAGGLSVAAGAAQLGVCVALIENKKMGGDCLNYGCVPSKALIAAARHAKMQRETAKFGIKPVEPDVDFRKVYEHIHQVIATIEPNDSEERFTKLGVQVIKGHAKFIDKDKVAVDDKIIHARRFVIATGSSAFIPPIDGLDGISYLTNETLFDLQERPSHLVVIGGGPIGCEIAQAYRLLGVPVTILEKFNLMPKDDPELVNAVRQQFKNDGIKIFENTDIEKINPIDNQNFMINIKHNNETHTIHGSHLLVAPGRRANVSDLNLEKAGIQYSPKGIKANKCLRTTNKKVYAIGDVTGGLQFTHAAGYHASLVIRSSLFRLPAKVNYNALPWVTYTTPELAHVGLNEGMAKAKQVPITITHWPFKENDRAISEYATDGLIKVITNKKGVILGASIVGENAGELILPWVQAVQLKLKMSKMAGLIAPYPTLSEVSKRVAGHYFTPMLFSEKIKKLVHFLTKFG